MPRDDARHAVACEHGLQVGALDGLVVQREAAVPERAVLVDENVRVRWVRLAAQRGAHGVVHRLPAGLEVGGADPGVQEQRVVDPDHRVVVGDPVAVRPAGLPGEAVLDVAQRELLLPLRAEGVVEGGQALLGRIGAQVVERLLVVLLAPAPRAAVDEGGVLAGMHVAQVALDVHRLVVADERMHAPARASRLALEPHEVVHDRAAVRPAIGHVAELDEVGRPADPVAVGVDQIGLAQHVEIFVVVAFEVADGDHARDPVPLGLSERGGTGEESCGEPRERTGEDLRARGPCHPQSH